MDGGGRVVSMKVLAILFLVAAVSAEVVDIKLCEGVQSDKCTIHEIRVDPCRSKSRACKIVKGNNASISFDFTPHFSATKMKTAVFWNTVPWDSVDPDACKATACPLEAGKKQTYNATMHIGKKLPDGTYTFEWQIIDEDNQANKCCFKPSVQLKKK